MPEQKKTAWFVQLPGRPAFPMLSGDGPISKKEALAAARVIWPDAKVK